MNSYMLQEDFQLQYVVAGSSAGTGSHACRGPHTLGRVSRVNASECELRACVMSRNQAVYRSVRAAGQLHTQLRDKRGEQLIEQLHQGGIAGELVGTVALDGLDAGFLYVARHDAGKRTAQIRCQLMWRLRAIELQRPHRLVGYLEGLLE